MSKSRTLRHPPQRKAKKSYTLSAETVAFLEGLRTIRKAESVSSVLEDILQNVRREQERASIEQAVTEYYSSLSQSELNEQAAWGDFALRQIPKEGRG